LKREGGWTKRESVLCRERKGEENDGCAVFYEGEGGVDSPYLKGPGGDGLGFERNSAREKRRNHIPAVPKVLDVNKSKERK